MGTLILPATYVCYYILFYLVYVCFGHKRVTPNFCIMSKLFQLFLLEKFPRHADNQIDWVE